MSSIHVPQRLEGETFQAYKLRRAASKAAASLGFVCAENANGQWERTGETVSLRGIGGGISARKQLRDAQRTNGKLRGIYGQGLQTKFNRDRAEQQAKLSHRRDEDGAFTLTGHDEVIGRRKWLAGISAQRGY